MIKRIYKAVFFSRRFYWLLVAVIMLFVFSFGLPWLFPIAQVVVIALLVVLLLDFVVSFSNRQPVKAERELPDSLGNGDQNKIILRVTNGYPFTIQVKLIDELPEQLQMRNFSIYAQLKPNELGTYEYWIRPTERGEFVFHHINVFIKTPLGLVVRRKIIEAEKKVKVLPSFKDLRKFELQAYSNRLSEAGNRKIRKLGHSLEFEQIKEYVTGR